MFANIKELIVLLALSLVVFRLAKSACLHFMPPEDFARRRNLWLALTVCAFLSPSFWIFVGIAAIAIAWAARRDSNPVSLYLLFYSVIPPLAIYIPIVGIGQLFALSESRLLAIVLLLPLSLSLYSRNENGLARKWSGLDIAVVLYLVLQVALVLPYESVTNSLRRAILMILDVLVVYYAFSRAVSRREKLVDAMAVFVLVGAIAASVGIFESLRGWLLYERIAPTWGTPNLRAFLMRGDSLRAQAAAGHSLTFGYTLAMALAFWLHLRTHIASRAVRWGATLLLCAGIYVCQSRGPWLTAVVVYFAYLAFSPGGSSAFFKGAFIALLLGAGLSFTPAGGRVIDLLPFVGTAEQETVAYRQQLGGESWRLIWQHPLLGDPFVMRQMEDLRQGEGLIDLMNAYAAVALFSGLIGLALFAAMFAGSMFKAFAGLRHIRHADPDTASMGAALIAAMIGSLFFMAAASIDWIEYVLMGLLCAYASLTNVGRSVASSQPVFAGRPSSAAFGRG